MVFDKFRRNVANISTILMKIEKNLNKLDGKPSIKLIVKYSPLRQRLFMNFFLLNSRYIATKVKKKCKINRSGAGQGERIMDLDQYLERMNTNTEVI